MESFRQTTQRPGSSAQVTSNGVGSQEAGAEKAVSERSTKRGRGGKGSEDSVEPACRAQGPEGAKAREGHGTRRAAKGREGWSPGPRVPRAGRALPAPRPRPRPHAAGQSGSRGAGEPGGARQTGSRGPAPLPGGRRAGRRGGMEARAQACADAGLGAGPPAEEGAPRLPGLAVRLPPPGPASRSPSLPASPRPAPPRPRARPRALPRPARRPLLTCAPPATRRPPLRPPRFRCARSAGSWRRRRRRAAAPPFRALGRPAELWVASGGPRRGTAPRRTPRAYCGAPGRREPSPFPAPRLLAAFRSGPAPGCSPPPPVRPSAPPRRPTPAGSRNHPPSARARAAARLGLWWACGGRGDGFLRTDFLFLSAVSLTALDSGSSESSAQTGFDLHRQAVARTLRSRCSGIP